MNIIKPGSCNPLVSGKGAGKDVNSPRTSVFQKKSYSPPFSKLPLLAQQAASNSVYSSYNLPAGGSSTLRNLSVPAHTNTWQESRRTINNN